MSSVKSTSWNGNKHSSSAHEACMLVVLSIRLSCWSPVADHLIKILDYDCAVGMQLVSL